MQLVEEDVHRALLYVAMASREGVGPTVEQLDAFAGRPGRLQQRRGGLVATLYEQTGLAQTMESLAGALKIESYSDYLIRVGWIEERAGGCVATPLGLSVRRALDLAAEATQTDLLTTVIDPEDEYAYARVLERIGDTQDSLLVDAYLKLEGFIDVRGLAAITRILTSDERGQAKGKLGAFKSITPRDELELRVLDVSQMHDRYVIPRRGPVIQLSTSLNSIGRRIGVVVTLDAPASEALRAHYETAWDGAELVLPEPGS